MTLGREKTDLGNRRVITAFRPCVLAWLNTLASSTPSAAAPSRTGPNTSV